MIIEWPRISSLLHLISEFFTEKAKHQDAKVELIKLSSLTVT